MAPTAVAVGAGLIAADIVMIVTGLLFALSQDAFTKWTWYTTRCAAFLAVYYILFGAMRQEAQARDAERRAAYNRNLAILVALWRLYPILSSPGRTAS